MDQLAKYLVLLALLLILGFAAGAVHSFDIFWQLLSGRYILESGSFIRTDLFTLVPDVPRYEHCWLHDIMFYLAHALGGYTGVSLFKGFLLVLTAGFLVATARLRQSSWLAILLVLPFFLRSSGGWLERPQLWTFLACAVFLYFLERHHRDGDWKVFWLIPISVLWANLHAGAVLALALLIAHLVGEVRWQVVPGEKAVSKKSYWMLWGLAGGILLTAFATPYPDKLLEILLHSPTLGATTDAAGNASGRMVTVFNMDWRPTTFWESPWFFYSVSISAVVIFFGWQRFRLTDLCLLGGLVLMGMKLNRHTPFLFFGMIAILPAYLDAAWSPLQKRLSPASWRWASGALMMFAVVVMVWFGLPVHKRSGWFQVGLRSWHYPVEATRFVEKHALPGNLYNTYDWGGYMAWELYPEYPVFWDGRQDSEEMFRLGWNVMTGQPDWSTVLARFDVKTIVTRPVTIASGQRYELLDRLALDGQWALVFRDDVSLVFVRRSAVEDSWLQEHDISKRKISDTIMESAALMLLEEPRRYFAWWEIARIFMLRGQDAQAFAALERFRMVAPQPHPKVEAHYKRLYPIYGQKKQ